MLEAYGWIIVRTSSGRYIDADMNHVDDLDDRLDQDDANFWAQLRDWLNVHDGDLFKWQFYEHFNNNTSGICNLLFREITVPRSCGT